MKRTPFLFLFFITNLFIFSTTHAQRDPDIDVSDISQEKIDPSSGDEDKSPFSMTGRIDVVQPAEIKEGFFEKDDVRFMEAELEFNMVYYYCEKYKEGATVTLGYTLTELKWENNPWFDQSEFHTASLSFGGFTGRLCNWFWRGQFTLNIDSDQWDFNDYAFYDLILWGRYEYCKNFGVHIGLIGETGMKMDRVYPIIGFDWQISRDWKLNAVFPVNMSLDYKLTKHWSAALAIRNFNSRFRVGPKEAHRRSLVRYQNVGTELAMKYEDSAFNINIHAGMTLGGKVRIANSNNDHPHHYKLKAAPYVGAEANVQF